MEDQVGVGVLIGGGILFVAKWIAMELAGEALYEVLGRVFGPVFRPVFRRLGIILAWMATPAGVWISWAAAIASCFVMGSDLQPDWIGPTSFLASWILALVITFAYRDYLRSLAKLEAENQTPAQD